MHLLPIPEAGITPESASLLQGVCSALPDSVLILGADGRYLWVSRAGAEILGLPAEGLVGRHWREIQEGSLLHRVFLDNWDLALERGAPVRECLAHHGAEGLRQYELTLSAVRGPLRAPMALVAVLRDTTARKEMETALKQTEEQLRHVQRVDALGKLAGGIAHDFNNLMTVVNGYSDLLLQSLPPEPLQDQEAESSRALVQEIRKAGQKAALLTQQLLAFSRKQAYIPRPLDMNQIVADMEKMLRRSLPGPIQIDIDLQVGLPAAIGDPVQVAQVLMNLVLNARDAMPRGGRIRIRTFEAFLDGTEASLMLSPGPGRFPALAVEDDGVGIGPEIRHRLFEPFFSTKDKGKGTGLGLSTVFGILKDAAGGIALDSKPRQGSAFTVYLPPADETSPGRAPETVLPAARSRPLAATVLLVEDEDPVRRLVAGILRADGYQVLEAECGAKALQIFSAHQDVDLVLTDIVMPGMNGRELIQALQAVRPTMRVVFMSGYIDDEAFVEGLGEGSMHFLAKPFSPQELSAKVRETLEAPRALGKTPGPN